MVWSGYSPKKRPRQSRDRREDNNLGDGVAVKWAEENDELVKMLSHTLRMVSPHEYASGLDAGKMRRKVEKLEPLFQAWCGVALNEGMTGEGGMVHKYVKILGWTVMFPGGSLQGGLWS